MKNDRQIKSRQHQQFKVQKSNTTKDGSQLRPSRRSRREKEKRQKSTTVVHEQEKPGPMTKILMLARKSRRALGCQNGMHKHAGNRNRRGGSPRKSTGTIHHHQEIVWKLWETTETSKGQGRKAYP